MAFGKAIGDDRYARDWLTVDFIAYADLNRLELIQHIELRNAQSRDTAVDDRPPDFGHFFGEVTPERLDCLRAADAILIEEIRAAGLYDEIWQALAVFLPVRSVGVMGDARTYDNVVALRCVTSVDAMTADWTRLPHDVLERISSRITNEVKGVNRVVYDISSKPPATIEWE